MSSAVVSTSAARGRPFLFDAEAEPEVHSPYNDSKKPPGTHESPITHALPSKIKNQKSAIPLITPASHLEVRPAPEMVSSGIPAIDTLTGGLPRGCLTEICGPASSGRTTLLLAALAAATRRGEFCVVVDASDALDPHFAAAAGAELDRLLWVRCSESSPQRERSPQRHPSTSLRACPEPVGGAGSDTEEKSLKEQIQLRSKNQVEHRIEQVLRATGSAARKRRLRPDRPRLRRRSAAGSPAHPADHLVPLPPRGREQAHNPTGHRAAPNSRKLLLAATAVGIAK